MCGIFTLLNYENKYSIEFITQQFKNGSARGPENSQLSKVSRKAMMGFHRLAINGLTQESSQPIIKGDLVLICNGEIYNYKELYALMTDNRGKYINNYEEYLISNNLDENAPVLPNTHSDCEIILWLYERYGMEHTLQLLDGVFSFILLDQRSSIGEPMMYVARDPYGVRPLYCIHQIEESDDNLLAMPGDKRFLKNIPYYLSGNTRNPQNTALAHTTQECTIGFASELKVLSRFVNDMPSSSYKVEQFQPGTYSIYTFSDKVCSQWKPISQNIRYHHMAFSKIAKLEREEVDILTNVPLYINAVPSYNDLYFSSKKRDVYLENANDTSPNLIRDITRGIQTHLVEAVEKRCSTTERPIACLLSGGLDSSLITALVSEYHKRHELPQIETYSIGLPHSVDLKYAKLVAEHLGTKHTEIIISEKEMCHAIPNVIRAIESYDTTTVRASIGNYLLGEYISKHSEAKVIFNGDGSDELLGGYLYMKNAPDALEFDRECRRLLTDIHTFDVLRSDKCISSHGLEPRTPFLDRAWTQYYLSISPNIRHFPEEIEKYWLRYAFSKSQYAPASGLDSLLPDEVLWRKKEAFSDGVSGTHRSLYQILQEFCDMAVPLDGFRDYAEKKRYQPAMKHVHTNIPQTSEQYYYRCIFERFYPGMGYIIPYFWMPKYIKATDASARTLSTYINV